MITIQTADVITLTIQSVILAIHLRAHYFISY